MNRTQLYIIFAFSISLAQGCSPETAKSPDWQSAQPSQVSRSATSVSRVARPFFDRSTTGIDILVRAMGAPWTMDDVVFDETLLLGDAFKRITVRGGPRALIIDTLRSGQVTRFELQSGSESICGNSEFLEPGLQVLVSGLGLETLTRDERRSINVAWAQSSAAEIKLKGAVIRAASDGCKFILEFTATHSSKIVSGPDALLSPLLRN